MCVHNGRNNNLYTDVNYIRREEKLNKKNRIFGTMFLNGGENISLIHRERGLG